jgi:UDP-N-acetylmuramoylalanine--D-glutamate ligase
MECLVIGLAVTGEAVARQLVRRGHGVVVTDDRPTDAVRQRAAALDIELVEAPSVAALESLVKAADVVLPSPGVPAAHPCFALAEGYGVPVWSEFELAAQWAPDVPLAAVTGTNGKTTVVTLVTDMLVASGVPAVAAGNTDVPLIDAIDGTAEVIVVEASSFRLMHAPSFRPAVAAWLNLADDHLDWHPDMAHYAAAKARIWANQAGDDLAIANADDPVVMAALAGAGGRHQTFGLDRADWRWDRGSDLLTGPAGDIVTASALPSSRPHDLANALAASAVAVGAGAELDACRDVLRNFRGLPHRVQLVRDAGGVEYYDDSKATTPASVVAAVSGFDSVVLIAGGRSKSSLTALGEIAGHVRAVIAIGEAAAEVEAVFAGVRPVQRASSMDEAVAAAARAAQPGDAVLLSPGCASFDWYRNYGERGDDFARAVAELVPA